MGDMTGTIQAAIHQIVPLTKAFGIKVEEARSGYVRLSMVANELIINHLKIMHAVALYALAETAAGTIFAASLDFSKYTIINKRGEIRYLKKGVDRAVVEFSIPETELEEMAGRLEKGERVERLLQIEVKDTGGDVLCETEFEMLLRKWKKD